MKPDKGIVRLFDGRTRENEVETAEKHHFWGKFSKLGSDLSEIEDIGHLFRGSLKI
ncbi:hypothetical protein [Caproiciproducens galactitolivorans]|uniref:hypothetical protein n=1 Tax=Caproiciproducens galactitolivorans TaxID=642589 RepID=UPI0014386720|nr:hypothetical protein [Caproiciproducens galactitolivorans]